MPKTLEQILGGQPNLNLQLPDYADQFRQNMQNMNLAESARAGKYVPRTQQTSDLAFRQDALTSASTPPAQKEQSTTEQKPMSYADLFVATNPYRPQTAEEREAERKRNRRNAVFAAIGDGISALSNLYFTTKGAPNAYTGGSTLTGKMYERQEQLRKERQALDQQYFNAYMNAMKMDRDEDYKNQSLKMQLDQLAHNKKRQDAADAREAELQPYKVAYQKSQADKAAIAANYEEPYQQKRIGTLEAQINQRNASAAASYSRSTGNGNKGTKVSYETRTIGGEDFELEKGFMNNNLEAIYNMLPDKIKNAAEFDDYGNKKSVSNSEKKKLIDKYATEEMKDYLRKHSRVVDNYVEQASKKSDKVADGDTAGWVNKNSDTASWVGK